MKKIKAWHFAPDSRVLAHQSDQSLTVAAGFVYSEPMGDIVICERGMHGSRRVYDALNNARGAFLSRVEMWGDVTEQDDKLVSRHREVIACADVTAELRLWGCWCIRNTPISGGHTVWDLLTDERSRNAVEVAEAFARGEATSDQLDAAGDAGWAAAGAAAGDAAGDAARAAAWAAADAAWVAAGDAARAVAWAAADAAWAAASKIHADELELRMLELLKCR